MKVANISPCVSNSGLTRFSLSGFCDSLIRHILVRESRTTDTLIKIFNNHITLLKLKKGWTRETKSQNYRNSLRCGILDCIMTAWDISFIYQRQADVFSLSCKMISFSHHIINHRHVIEKEYRFLSDLEDGQALDKTILHWIMICGENLEKLKDLRPSERGRKIQ